jgi:nitrate reductase gamma subunit
VEAKPEPAALGQAHTMWWVLGIIAVATLAGGGLLLLRRAGNL